MPLKFRERVKLFMHPLYWSGNFQYPPFRMAKTYDLWENVQNYKYNRLKVIAVCAPPLPLLQCLV